MSLSSRLIKECNSILESNYILVDGDKKTTIAGNTDTNKIAVRSEDGNKLTKEEIQNTLDNFKNDLNTDGLDEITDDLPDETQDM